LAHALFVRHPLIPRGEEFGDLVFAPSLHPTPTFEPFVNHLLSTSTKVSAGNTKVSMQKVGADLPLVRVDVLNATRQVHHHYDYKKDGHKRTYTMHIETSGAGGAGVGEGSDSDSVSHSNNGKSVKVYLTRDGDEHLIPYKTIKSVTLIAVLRMGLVPELKAHAYDKFIGMPLFEDMAPWNIVMEGKNYNYIDYDTQDKVSYGIPHTHRWHASMACTSGPER